VSYEWYKKFLRLAKAANITLIRVWGGGLIEKESFYRLCDEYGIMVWQEFIQSSSGIDNIPSKRAEFLKLLSETAEEAVKEKRNHISLTFWCGGNELMDKGGVPSTYEDLNIALLKKICDEHDPQRLLLPTSASGPTEWIDNERPGKNHDVHGPWKYGGVEKHYAYFNASDSMLHSEFGNDGMANLRTLKKILTKKNLKVTTVAENPVWRHHGEWWDTYQYRDRELFGEMTSLEDYIAVSQYMQAEGIRYAIESNRRRVWQNSGSIVWQLNEPWPNTACTCLVDYYAEPKLAYFFCADAYEPIHASLRYDKLVYAPGESFSAQLFAHNDLKETQADVSCVIKSDSGEKLAQFDYSLSLKENSCQKAGDIRITAPEGAAFFAECSVKAGKKTLKNTYMFFISKGEKLSINAIEKFTAEYRGKRKYKV
jgi:beta-mannosidase